jgi:hypothetical protein
MGSPVTFQTSDGYGQFAFTQTGAGTSLTLSRNNTIYAFNSNISPSVANIFSNISFTNSALPLPYYANTIPLGLGIPTNNPLYTTLLPISNVNSPNFASINYLYVPGYASPAVSLTNLPTIGGYPNPGFDPSKTIRANNTPIFGFNSNSYIPGGLTSNILVPDFNGALPLSDWNFPTSRSLYNTSFVPGGFPNDPSAYFSTASAINSPFFGYTNRDFIPESFGGTITWPTNIPVIGGWKNTGFNPGIAVSADNMPNFGYPNPNYKPGVAFSSTNYPIIGVDTIFINNQRSNVFTPTVAINYWKNGNEVEYYNGVETWGSSNAVSNATIFPYYSETKSITALMYARMKTLGIIPPIKRVDDIFPKMKNVRWSLSTLSTTPSIAATDVTGSNTQTQYMLANDVFALPSSNSTATAFVPANYTLVYAPDADAPFYSTPLTGISNNYIHFYDFDATVQALYKANSIASINQTDVYSNIFNAKTLSYVKRTNADLISNIYQGITNGYITPGGTIPAGNAAAIVSAVSNCGFSPVFQSFLQSPYGSVPGNRIWNKLNQSNINGITDATSSCAVAKGYGLNIAGTTALNTNLTAINAGFFSSSNTFMPVITTQYMAPVSTVNLSGQSFVKYGGILDGAFTVHPGAIPVGVTYNPRYQPITYLNVPGTNFPIANVSPPVTIPGFSNVVYSPLSSNLYINTSDAAQPLYLDDIFSESVGFVCGFEQWGFGNGTYGGLWGSGNDIYTSNILYNPQIESLKNLGLNLVPELARSSVCLASNTAPVNHAALDATSNANFCTSNTVTLRMGDPTQNAVTTFNSFINNFQGNTYVQLLPHGIYNYNSSGFLGTMCIEQLYNQYYGTSFTYYEILKKELLDPVGSGMVYYSNNYRVATTWAVNPSAANPSAANQFYITSSNPVSPFTAGGLDSTTPTSYLGQKVAAFNQAPSINRLYNGNFGLFGTLKDISKVLRVFARRGLDQDGNVLISTDNITNITLPRVSLADYAGAQNYFPSSLTLVYGGEGTRFGLGGTTVGPGYSDYVSKEIKLLGTAGPLGKEIRDTNLSNLFNDTLTTRSSFPDMAAPAWMWSGAGGTWFYAGINEQYVAAYAFMDSSEQFGFMLQSALNKYLGQDLRNPTSNAIVSTTSGRPVPYVPEPVGGAK